MLRTERPRLANDYGATSGGIQVMTRELLLAVAPPPPAHSYALSGWPTWLVPSFRSGGHRTGSNSSEAER
jgi:hypothetical protein